MRGQASIFPIDSASYAWQDYPIPRQLRIEYPGAMYHVMSRGNGRQDIFLDDVDRHDFLKTLSEACQKTGWQAHACCLMSNHYHLVPETPNANRVAVMTWLQSASTMRLNPRHQRIGHVQSGRSKAQWVEGSGNGYFEKQKPVRIVLDNGLAVITAIDDMIYRSFKYWDVGHPHNMCLFPFQCLNTMEK